MDDAPPRPRPWRTGPGTRNHPGPPPAVVAERLAKMQASFRGGRAARIAATRAWVEACAGMDLDALRRSVPTRLWTVAMYHLGGWDGAAIARAIGYASPQSVAKALEHPAVKRVIELVRNAQLELVMRGGFGVAAAAKAAAPAVMEHVAELAGGRKAPDGSRIGRAARDSDTIKAADLVLTVAGDKVERKATLHVHLLEQLSDAELETFATTGRWPERYRALEGPAGGGDP
jgi:hypothetical protein